MFNSKQSNGRQLFLFVGSKTAILYFKRHFSWFTIFILYEELRYFQQFQTHNQVSICLYLKIRNIEIDIWWSSKEIKHFLKEYLTL